MPKEPKTIKELIANATSEDQARLKVPIMLTLTLAEWAQIYSAGKNWARYLNESNGAGLTEIIKKMREQSNQFLEDREKYGDKIFRGKCPTCLNHV